MELLEESKNILILDPEPLSLQKILQKFFGVFELSDEINLFSFKKIQIGAARSASFHRQDQIDMRIVQGHKFSSPVQAFLDIGCQRNPIIPGIAPPAVFYPNLEHINQLQNMNNELISSLH